MADEQKQNPLNTPVLNIPMNVQLVYTNGANINMSQADIQVAFTVNGRPIIATAMSLAVAKNLQVSLLKVISEYERKTESIIPDINKIAEQLKKP